MDQQAASYASPQCCRGLPTPQHGERKKGEIEKGKDEKDVDMVLLDDMASDVAQNRGGMSSRA